MTPLLCIIIDFFIIIFLSFSTFFWLRSTYINGNYKTTTYGGGGKTFSVAEKFKFAFCIKTTKLNTIDETLTISSFCNTLAALFTGMATLFQLVQVLIKYVQN